PKPAERQNDFGGVLGGPIWKNHTFFFFSYEGLRLRLPQTATFTVPSNAARLLLPASVKPLVELFPVTSNPDLGNGTARLTAGYSDPATLDAYSIRVDHAFGSRVTLFGRYSDTPSHTTQRTPAGPSQLTTTDYHTRTLTMGLTQIISPLLSNE